MTANLVKVAYVGNHPESLGHGQPIEPGQHYEDVDLSDAHNAELVRCGLLLILDGDSDPEQLEGEELHERARELEIKGRSKMSAAALRAAIVQREAELQADGRQPTPEDDAGAAGGETTQDADADAGAATQEAHS